MHLIQEIGSYAGLAAIPGLAVLSALYFSQARDVRRLRDWAGRAPERSAEQAMGGRVAAQPQAQRPAVAAGNGAEAQTGERTAAKPGALTPAAVASAAAGATKPPPGRAGAATGSAGSLPIATTLAAAGPGGARCKSASARNFTTCS